MLIFYSYKKNLIFIKICGQTPIHHYSPLFTTIHNYPQPFTHITTKNAALGRGRALKKIRLFFFLEALSYTLCAVAILFMAFRLALHLALLSYTPFLIRFSSTPVLPLLSYTPLFPIFSPISLILCLFSSYLICSSSTFTSVPPFLSLFSPTFFL